ncbi:hypothetical protein GCM10009550_71470 [Actinocorallia libanotica]|uniref:Uncharacterized protein n=2 Tax=Actinocorallia libanotica TaxID=46162 RepID=A0ABN1RXZ3_9ACTN
MLRRAADGLLTTSAAVDLLIGHRVWLTRGDFARYVEVETDPRYAGDTPMALVRWKAAVTAVKAGRLVCTSSEAAMLRVAASIAEGLPVDLRDAVGGLDARNIALVLEALATANGRRMVVTTR